ncbi:MAG: hypothetical protein WCQ53_09140 [bacterium]
MLWAILISILFSFNIQASTPKDVAKYRSYLAYKQALNEYNQQNYEKAEEYTETSLELFPNNKKSRELLTKIREIGAEYYKTGESLIHFNKELATDYLNKAKVLLNPSDNKTHAKVTALLKDVEGSGETPGEAVELGSE